MKVSSINAVGVAFALMLYSASFAFTQDQEKKSGPEFTFPICGKVIDQAGNPVSGVRVRINQPGIATEPVTQADGTFTLMASRKHIQQQFMIASSEDGSLQGIFKLPWRPDGKILEGVEIQIEPKQSISLVVTDEKGQPLPEANVGVVAGFRPFHQAQTNRNGNASFDIPVGLIETAVFAFVPGKGFDYQVFANSRDSKEKDNSHLIPKEPVHLKIMESNRFTVTLLDPQKKPVPGVKVYPWLLQKSGQTDNFNLSADTELFGATTNKDGVATFEWIPEWHVEQLTFWVNAKGYTRNRIDYQPGAIGSTRNLTEIVQKLVPVAGIIKNPDGTPAANVSINFDGAGDNGPQDKTVSTDNAGRFEFESAPETAYLVVSNEKTLKFNDSTSFAVHNNPINNLEFQLGKGTRVFGRLTFGPSRTPMPNKRISLGQSATEKHTLTRLDGTTYQTTVGKSFGLMTDDDGKFEFIVGAGNLTLRGPSIVKPVVFKLSGENPDKEIDFHADRPDVVTLAGKVMGPDGKPLANVKVEGKYITATRTRWLREVNSDSRGSFQLERETFPMAIVATTPDKKLVGIQRVSDMEVSTSVTMQPSINVTGRLVDEEGDPLTGQMLLYRSQLDYERDDNRRSYKTLFRDITTTDENGEFECRGLLPGTTVAIYKAITLNEQGGPLEIHGIATAKPMLDQKLLQLGDIVFSPEVRVRAIPEGEPAWKKAYQVDGRAATRFLNARKAAKPRSQLVLVMFADPNSIVAEQMGQLMMEDHQIQRMLYDFQIVSVNSTQAKLNFANQLAAKFKFELNKSDVIQLVAINVDGTVAAKSTILPNELNQVSLANFLQSAIPEPRNAREEFARAIQNSRQQNKKLIVLETATWCQNCRRLLQFFQETENTWNDDFLLLAVDQRWHGGQELCQELRSGGDGGLPWYGVLDSGGKVLATSNHDTRRNIALPLYEKDQKHFVDMFQSTAETLTSKEINQWVKILDAKLHPQK